MDINTLSEELEKTIDAHGMQVVLSTLEEICHGKAEHVRSNWQDMKLSQVWTSAAKAISKAWTKVGDLGL
jgi:hypothetical protein